jgi:hypothetical protein
MNFLNKYLTIAIYVLIALTAINSCNSCSSKKESQRLRKDVDSLSVVIKTMDNTMKSSYDKKELDIRMAIEGYEVSKRMLYDNNTVVRTTQRPDDIIIGYDNKIKELRAKLQ